MTGAGRLSPTVYFTKGARPAGDRLGWRVPASEVERLLREGPAVPAPATAAPSVVPWARLRPAPVQAERRLVLFGQIELNICFGRDLLEGDVHQGHELEAAEITWHIVQAVTSGWRRWPAYRDRRPRPFAYFVRDSAAPSAA